MFAWFKRKLSRNGWLAELKERYQPLIYQHNHHVGNAECFYTDTDGRKTSCIMRPDRIYRYTDVNQFLTSVVEHRKVNFIDLLLETVTQGEINYGFLDGVCYEAESSTDAITLVLIYANELTVHPALVKVKVTKQDYRQLLSFIHNEIKLVESL